MTHLFLTAGTYASFPDQKASTIRKMMLIMEIWKKIIFKVQWVLFASARSTDNLILTFKNFKFAFLFFQFAWTRMSSCYHTGIVKKLIEGSPITPELSRQTKINYFWWLNYIKIATNRKIIYLFRQILFCHRVLQNRIFYFFWQSYSKSLLQLGTASFKTFLG